MVNENCTCPGYPPVPNPNPPQYICVDVYTVVAGDTLYSISQKYNVSVPVLMQVNRILNPYNLLIGQKICIPGKATDDTPVTPEPEPNPMPKPEPTPTPTPPQPNPPQPTPTGPTCPEETPDQTPVCRGIYHTVVAGDTLYMIAKKHKVSLDVIMNANPNLDPYNLRIGMKICVPTCENGGNGNNGNNGNNNNNNNNNNGNNGNNGNNNMGGRCPGGMIYNTQRGDTLARILDRFGITYEALKKANPGVDFCASLETLALCIPMNQ